ncbi:hypothetical protein ABIB80_004514 [Bradyrhizobium sp. i1.15.2]
MRAGCLADGDEEAPIVTVESDQVHLTNPRAGGADPGPGGNGMKYAGWPHVNGDLSSVRRGAAIFLNSLEEICGSAVQQNWITRWTSVGDDHCVLADLNIKKGALDKASEAWLCALTAFEIARRLADENDPQCGDVLVKIEAGIHRLRLNLEQKVERVKIACCDQAEFPACFLRAGDLAGSAVICITREEETAETLLGRLLPAVVDRGISILIVSHDDVSTHLRGRADILLSCCLDYLAGRPEVDPGRIGVYGEGFSAVLATDFAASDHRVAAAVCDGGLWNWARTVASVGWMTRAADILDADAVLAGRSRLVRRLRCPVLVVAGGRGTVSVSEAIKLQAECVATGKDLELAIPHTTRTPMGEIENFVTSDDFTFGWLKSQLASTPATSPWSAW